MLAKLDTYEYRLLPGVIRIALDRTNDPIIVDILSEIDRANDRVYVEGQYFMMYGYDVYSVNGRVYLDLEVTNVE